jgi:hypothetical protein
MNYFLYFLRNNDVKRGAGIHTSCYMGHEADFSSFRITFFGEVETAPVYPTGVYFNP